MKHHKETEKFNFHNCDRRYRVKQPKKCWRKYVWDVIFGLRWCATLFFIKAIL